MPFYIRSTASISPQQSFRKDFFSEEPLNHEGNSLHCVEPDYAGGIIDPKLMRRMSRIIKMGVAAALECLAKTEIKSPDAIITGTAYGCLEDTEIFLTRMVENKEELLTPTAFIQSTHNTVGAQIALLLQCHEYNNTFVHRGFSFENALLDAMMLLQEDEADHVLVGAVDEITKISHAILNRFGIYRQHSAASLDLCNPAKKGTIAGEGASFFLLVSEQSEKNLAQLNGLKTFYKPSGTDEVKAFIDSFLAEQKTTAGEIDVLLLGNNGDLSNDKIYKELSNDIFPHKAIAYYKHLCGEYPTSASFALWLAANMLNRKSIPAWVWAGKTPTTGQPKKVLIYNHYQNIHHSLFLVSAC